MERKFEDLNTYVMLAKKVVSKFAPSFYSGLSRELLSNEDAISDIASALMTADWKWDKDRTGYNGQKKTSFKVQKNRLVTRSPVFAAALDNFAEGENATYKISDMSPKAVKEMLRFFYTDQVENLEVHARELLMAGDKYDLPKLRNMAELKLCQTLNHDNVLDCLKFADLINTAKLKNYAIACIANTFETISQRPEWADFAAQNPVLVEAINAKRIEREYCEEAIQVQPGPDPFNNPF